MATQIEIAAHIDLSRVLVNEYLAKGIMPRGGTLDEIRVAYIRHLRAKKGGASDEKARLDAARAALAEHELEKKLGVIVPATDGDRTLISLATVTSARIQSIPSRIAPELAVETEVPRCQEIVEAAVTEALHDLAEEGRLASERLAR